MQINKWFNSSEFACKDENNTPAPYIDGELIDILTDVREFFGVPLTITSSYRTPEHNRIVGGRTNSQHLYIDGHAAADIQVKGTRPQEVYDYINTKYPDRLGLGLYKVFVHVDTKPGKARRWDG